MMQDLSASEIEALSKAIGTSSPIETEHEGKSNAETEESKISTQKSTPSGIAHAQFPQLKEIGSTETAIHQFQEKLTQVNIEIEVVLGRTKMPLSKLLTIKPGSLITLDKLAGELVDIEANGKTIAHGEVVIVEECFGVKILQIAD
jgi:flagellar motor switch protein FliN